MKKLMKGTFLDYIFSTYLVSWIPAYYLNILVSAGRIRDDVI